MKLKRIRRTTEQKRALIAEVDQLIKTEKLTATDAIHKVGILPPQYYKWKNGQDLGNGRRRSHTTRPTAIMSFEVPPETEAPVESRSMILVGPTSLVRAALDKLTA